MSNDKHDATFHPHGKPTPDDDADPLSEPPTQSLTPADAPVPHAHMDEH
jgi:hypothetical protein